MCGLTGILGPGITKFDLKMLKELAYISGLRGQDGAGIVQGKLENYKNPDMAKRWNEYTIEKTTSDINYFQWYHARHPEGNRNLFEGVNNNFFAVHVRAATQGGICRENSHPFEFSKIIGMHNGTLVDYEYNKPGQTDSELLLQDINDKGIVETLSNLSPASAYALVIIEKETGKISFVRNKERGLYCCYNKFRDVMYWASEEWMLRGIFSRNTEKMYDDCVYIFEEHKVHSLYISDFSRNKHPIYKTESYVNNKSIFKKNKSDKYSKNYKAINWDKNQNNNTNDNKDNVVKLEIPKLYVSKKIPYGTCIDCKKKLNLVEQFFASKFPMQPTLFVCRECEPPFEPNSVIVDQHKHKVG